MTFPAVQLGLVLRYSFLWSDEARQGQTEGAKDRPCAVIVAINGADGTQQVAVVPITHAPPRAGQPHVALTAAECREAGLDLGPHWVVVDEVNSFIWPGHDLRLIAGQARYDYGQLPKGALRRIVAAVLALQAQRAGPRMTQRD